MRTLFLLVLFSLLSIACSRILDNEIVLSIYSDKRNYAVNEKITITIANETADVILLQNCCHIVGFVVERQAEDGWDLVSEFSCPALCDAAPVPLPPGQQHRDEIRISEPSQYRLAGKAINRTKSTSVISTIYSEKFIVE